MFLYSRFESSTAHLHTCQCHSDTSCTIIIETISIIVFEYTAVIASRSTQALLFLFFITSFNKTKYCINCSMRQYNWRNKERNRGRVRACIRKSCEGRRVKMSVGMEC